ncbi:MAG: hypothetical protein C4582_05420 [Desulfobacteraceae bacterium]|nr:MAG: hypothetical protein C4582_05420 [Desulfobacteraceae bacterium]
MPVGFLKQLDMEDLLRYSLIPETFPSFSWEVKPVRYRVEVLSTHPEGDCIKDFVCNNATLKC